jgi:hypothetical protein
MPRSQLPQVLSPLALPAMGRDAVFGRHACVDYGTLGSQKRVAKVITVVTSPFHSLTEIVGEICLAEGVRPSVPEGVAQSLHFWRPFAPCFGGSGTSPLIYLLIMPIAYLRHATGMFAPQSPY